MSGTKFALRNLLKILDAERIFSALHHLRALRRSGLLCPGDGWTCREKLQEFTAAIGGERYHRVILRLSSEEKNRYWPIATEARVICAKVGVPHWRMVISSSVCKISRTRSTPSCPKAVKP